MAEPRIFDSVSSPLHKGINLVEASAGTGKTYAIAMLVLRAIVELEMAIERILVVTFTRAAAEELRGRIRSRLVEGRDILRGGVSKQGENFDEVLCRWAENIKNPDRAMRCLELALYDIDRAGIFTIHGFCQRMLVDFALESGQLFDVELLNDVEPVRKEVAHDFWRENVYPLDTIHCAVILDSFPDPEALLDSVCGGMREGEAVEPDVIGMDECRQALVDTWQEMCDWWEKNGGKLLDHLESLVKSGGFRKKFTESFKDWQRGVHLFLTENNPISIPRLELLKKENLLAELNGSKFRGAAKKEAVTADWVLPGELLDNLLTAMAQLLLCVRKQLAEELIVKTMARLDRLGQLSFDDLIGRLAHALREKESRLPNLIRSRFTMALIDEFQDTDNGQWAVFSSVFTGSDHYLYLIGDPKQSIYRFRGADIHSYFLAKKQAGCHLTLKRNFRSHPLLVDEINRIFSYRDNPFLLDKRYIDFLPVIPARTAEDLDLTRDGRSMAGLVYCMLAENDQSKDGRWTSGKAGKLLCRFTIAETIKLLDRKEPIRFKNGEERNLLPRDIAVLVRSNRQAKEYLEELTCHGVPAVISSSRSIYESEECRELLTLLQAVAGPGDIGLVKRAIALRWFGFSGNQLYDLWRDESRFGEWHERFFLYNELWKNGGLLVMMQRLVEEEEVFITLSTVQGGERAITNIQHLLELVQELESSEHMQMGQVLLRLQRLMSTAAKEESGELRLDTDAEAVRIITMHSAKGLEFPVVFCPWLWYTNSAAAKKQSCVRGRDESGLSILDLGSERFDKRREVVLHEERAEGLRLLYVALTRATVRCYVMWADVKPGSGVGESFQSPLGYLLFPRGRCSYDEQVKLFRSRRGPGTTFFTVPRNIKMARWSPFTHDGELVLKEFSARNLHTDWQMSSYSSLTSLSEYGQERDPGAREEKETTGTIPVPGLPMGPHFGNVVHEILESVPFSGLAKPAGYEDEITTICRRYGMAIEQESLRRLLAICVTTPISPEGKDVSFSLAGLSENVLLKEMEFYFRMSRVETEMINSVLIGEPAVCSLGHRGIEGYLTGLMDLICEIDSRFYIFDYKTNYLGDCLDDYNGEKLLRAMVSHNYGLQFWIYTVVLHRHLKNIIHSYSYEKHFGGVFYLFVRGMVPERRNSGVFFTLPDKKKVMELERIFGREYEQ
jgi:exodeoxyribonuclease V beta subunit